MRIYKQIFFCLEGLNRASASTKKQKQFNPSEKNCQSKVTHTNQPGGLTNPPTNQQPGLPTTTPHQQLGRFVPHSQQSQGAPPPNHPPFRIPPPQKFRPSLQSNPRGPFPRPDGGHQPFPPPPPFMGQLLPQPNLPRPPRPPNEPSNAPQPRNSIRPQGPPSRYHPQPHFETPTREKPFGARQLDPRFRPPFRNVPSTNYYRQPTSQLHPNIQESPPQNGSTFPNGPPINNWTTEHAPQQLNIRQ